MVYNDLMINNTSVSDYNINRSQPVTIQCPITWVGAPADRDALPQPCSDLGSDYCSSLPYGFSATICGTSVNVNYIYCLITLATLVEHPKLGLIWFMNQHWNLLWSTLDNNPNPSRFSHIYTSFLAPLCHLAAELFKCRLVRRRRRQL